MGLDTKTYWLTDRQSQCDFDFEPILLSGRMLHKGYDRKGSVEKKNLWSWPQGVWRQDELIGDKLSVVK
jgi:hypothetical protein